jgi:hypothetical protein
MENLPYVLLGKFSIGATLFLSVAWGHGFSFLSGCDVHAALCLFFVHFDEEVVVCWMNNRDFDEVLL